MESFNHASVDHRPVNGLKTLRHSPYHRKSNPWFDMRVFYVRVSNFIIDDSTPENLTLNHIPLGPETIVEVNDGRSSSYLDYISVQLRRDRIDKNSEEATFVCTDSVRTSGSIRYEVCDGNDILLSGVLQMSNDTDSIGEVKNHNRTWNIKCQTHVAAAKYFLKGEEFIGPEILMPTLEVYVAGCFSATPTILTKILQIGSGNKHDMTTSLEPILESKPTELENDVLVHSSQVYEYRDHRSSDHDVDDECSGLYPTRSYMEEDDGELSWFNAGVRVGVGIGLGICLGVGLGVGLLVRSYQATSRKFGRRLL